MYVILTLSNAGDSSGRADLFHIAGLKKQLKEETMENKDYYIFEEKEEYPRKPQDEIDRENQQLSENLHLIINNSERIYKQEKYFYIQLSSAVIGTTTTGGRFMPLGVLLLVWEGGHLKDICPHCGGTVYITGAAGSALSGTHFWYGYCVKCKQRVTGRGSGFSRIWGPAFEMKSKYPNRRIIKRYNLKSEKWYDKLTEKRRPDEIIQDKIEGSTIEELVSFLKSVDGIADEK